MENIKRLKQTLPLITGKASRIRAGAFAFFMALAFLLPAQQGFEDRLTFKEIQDLLSEGIARRDIRKQALGWYKWAIYRESQTENRDSAFQYLARSVDLFLKANDTVAYHRARAELATRLSERSQADDALKMQQAALDYFRKKKNRRLETLVLAQMARVYQMQGDTARAIALRKEFREKGLLLKDTVLLINVFIDDIARFENEQNYTDALSLAFRVLQLADSSNRKEYIIWAQSTIGYLNEEIKDYRMALRFLRRAETSISSS